MEGKKRGRAGAQHPRGFVKASDYPDLSIAEFAKMADERMYEEKKRYYQEKIRDRRRT